MERLTRYVRTGMGKWETIRYHRLTIREKKILRLTAQGYLNADIACMLKVSMSTIKGCKRKLLHQKLHVSNIHEGIAVALRLGIL
jgi:DNA-binding NarL/FixJ family response regulator